MSRRISPTLVAALIFIIFDSFVFYAAYQNRKVQSQPIALSAPLPQFEWKGFDGKPHSTKELVGHVVVLHFWAAWCPPCRDEFPNMLKAAVDNKDIIFLTVSSDDTAGKPQQFIKIAPDVTGIKAPPNVLYAWDPNRTITYDEFLTVRYPETIFIDAQQRMRRKFSSPVDWDSASIRNYLKDLQAEK